MATDYDAPRKTDSDDDAVESLEALAVRRNDADTAVIDVAADFGDFELPGAALSGEECTVRVLVQHRHRLARQVGDRLVCDDCV